MKYDVIVIGSGPGGYVAAIRASQLGKKTAVVEKAEVGGICLNWGCIPTKALLKSAQVYTYINHAENYGIKVEGEVKPDMEAVVARSRGVAETMSKGVQYLLKKNNVDVIAGYGKLTADKQVEVTDAEGNATLYEADHIILATGSRVRELPALPIDGKKIIGYRQALVLDKLPESMVVVGSGAIGSEFAFFFTSMGVKVTLVEFLPNVVPNEDEEVSKQVERAFKKLKMTVMTEASVTHVDTTGEKCVCTIATKKGEKTVEADIVLSAVGVQTNIDNLGLAQGRPRSHHLRGETLRPRSQAVELRQHPRLHLHHTRNRLRRFERGQGHCRWLRGEDRQVPLHRFGKGHCCRQPRRLHQGRLRCQDG